MDRFWKLVATVGTFFGLVLVLGGVALFPPAAPVVLALAVVYGWMLFAYLQYRWGRQDELLHLLTAAVESGAPLAPAVLAYVQDRPRSQLREFWVGLLLFFVVPGYYWVWHRRHNFDRKATRLAFLLDMGVPLHTALGLVPGLASPRTVLAASVGASTGRLPQCLRGLPRDRFTGALLEVLPRLFYPLVVLFFMSLVVGFWVVYLLPKVEKIFSDWKAHLPWSTTQLAMLGRQTSAHLGLVLCAVTAGAALVAVLVGSSTARWYCPGLGRVYRMYVQGGVLKMLAIFLAAGKPLPEALAVLAESDSFPTVACRRLRAVRRASEQGVPLADALRQGGLLPAALVPLVEAAQRSGRLSWALAELGEELSARTVRALQRASVVLFPLTMTAVGLLAGFVAFGMFLPLVDLIWRCTT